MPAHSATAGSIILEEAYALSKMVDSSGWNGLLRNKITPSDVDLFFDNDGKILFVDLTSSYERWEGTLVGQRRGYVNMIRGQPHCAVLCRHDVTPAMGRKIDSLRDVDRFHVMVWDFEPIYSPVYDGAYWQKFVTTWVNDPVGPLRIRRAILGATVGLVKPRPPTTPPTADDECGEPDNNDNALWADLPLFGGGRAPGWEPKDKKE